MTDYPADTNVPPTARLITADMQAQMLRDVFRFVMTRWWMIAFFALVALALLVTAAPAVLSRDLLSVVLAVVILCAVAGLLLVLWLPARRGIALNYPVGFAASARVGPSTLTSSTALGSTEVQFAAFKAVHLTPDSVLLTLRATAGGAAVMPRVLLSDEETARLQLGVAGLHG